MGSELSALLEKQIKVFSSLDGGIISDIDGYRQTVEDPASLVLDPNNAKVHKTHDLEMIGHSLNAFRFPKKCDRGPREYPYRVRWQRDGAMVPRQRRGSLPGVVDTRINDRIPSESVCVGG